MHIDRIGVLSPAGSRAFLWIGIICGAAIGDPALAAQVPDDGDVTVRLAQSAAPAASVPQAPAPAPAAPSGLTWGPVKFSAQAEGGIVINPSRPNATGFDWGFKFQFMYGSDARYTHFLGEFDKAISGRYQIDIVEASLSFHLPVLTDGGIDLKLGQYPTPIGYEVIDPKANPFYTHSYIFNFGIPLKHTGGYAVLHVNPVLDIYGGGDSGEQTTIYSGDNNGAAAGLAGFGLNLLGGKLTVLALSHFGPENPTRTVPDANGKFRYENDIVLTYKATDALTLTTELNLIRDDAFHANGFGGAQYVSYLLNDRVALNARAEVWRDDNGFFVAAFPQNLGFVNSELGLPARVISAPPTTYGEITLGATFKPNVPAPIQTLMIRPEIRYDTSLNNTRPFNGGRDTGAFTIAADAIIGF